MFLGQYFFSLCWLVLCWFAVAFVVRKHILRRILNDVLKAPASGLLELCLMQEHFTGIIRELELANQYTLLFLSNMDSISYIHVIVCRSQFDLFVNWSFLVACLFDVVWLVSSCRRFYRDVLRGIYVIGLLMRTFKCIMFVIRLCLQRPTWCLLSSATRRFHSSSVSSAPPSVVSSASCVLSARGHKKTQPCSRGKLRTSYFPRQPVRFYFCSQRLWPTAAGHGSAHPVATCAHAAVALHLGLGAVLVGLVLQCAFCRRGSGALHKSLSGNSRMCVLCPWTRLMPQGSLLWKEIFFVLSASY